MIGTKTELVCAAAVVAIFIVGAMVAEPIESVVAAAMVPTAMGLAHRAILWRARETMKEGRAKRHERRERYEATRRDK